MNTPRRRGARAACHYRRSRRSCASARNACLEDARPHPGRPSGGNAVERNGFAAVDRANAQGGSRRHARDRQAWSGQRRAAGSGDTGHHRPCALRAARCVARCAHPGSTRSEAGSELDQELPGDHRSFKKLQHSNRPAWRPAGDSRRWPTGTHDGDGRAHHGLSRARDGSRSVVSRQLRRRRNNCGSLG